MGLYIAELERENRRLKEAIGESEERARELTDAKHEIRRRASRAGCALCGGTLLPVAVFAGHDISSPLPLSISTIRFGNPSGGFTHSAPIHSRACASCGYIHNFIDMPSADHAGLVTSDDDDEMPSKQRPDPGDDGHDGPETGQ